MILLRLSTPIVFVRFFNVVQCGFVVYFVALTWERNPREIQAARNSSLRANASGGKQGQAKASKAMQLQANANERELGNQR